MVIVYWYTPCIIIRHHHVAAWCRYLNLSEWSMNNWFSAAGNSDHAFQDEAWASALEAAASSGNAADEIGLLVAARSQIVGGALEAASQNTMDTFVDYALKRRFGWSEVHLQHMVIMILTCHPAMVNLWNVRRIQFWSLRIMSAAVDSSSFAPNAGFLTSVQFCRAPKLQIPKNRVLALEMRLMAMLIRWHINTHKYT